MSLTAMSLQDLRAFMLRETGIHLDAGKEAMIRARLEKRVRALGLNTLEAYLDRIKSDDGRERVELIDVLTTNHTAFFRDPHHFDFLRQWVQAARKQGQKRIRIWCAASSSGEEPYTLAMCLREAGIEDGHCDAQILCTDLSVTVLRKASEGVYPQERMTGVHPQQMQRFFTPEAGPMGLNHRAKPTLQSLLHFNRLNLSQMPYPMRGPFDLIFCRNVFIYFEPELIARILGEFARLLPSGGYLFVGSSESLTQHQAAAFKPAGSSIYRRI